MNARDLLCLALALGACAGDKLSSATSPASLPDAQQRVTQTSPWGETEDGLRCRVTLPAAIEQGMSVPATVELQDDPAKLSPGVRRLATFMPDAFLTLTLTKPKTGTRFEIKPFAFAGPPMPLTGTDLVALDGRRLKPWKVSFPLVREYTNLAPADYLCQVTFSYPKTPPTWPFEPAAGFDAASLWRGAVVSGTVRLRVLPETPQFRVFYIPKRLVVTKELTNLHPSDQPPSLAAIPVIRFFKADAKTVRLRVRNGHFLHTRIERQKTAFESYDGQALVPDAPNPIDGVFDYKGQDEMLHYRIEVFETATPGGHLEIQGPGAPGYRLIWSRTFRVSLAGQEFQRLPAAVVNVPAGTDNQACVALIRANPEVEQLSIANTGITDGSLALVGRLRHLRILYLYDTRVTDSGLAHLQNLIKLKTLILDGTKVTDSGLLLLRRLTSLRELDVRKTPVTDKGAAVVCRFPHLKQLDLSYTRIGDATIARLRNLKQLEWLDLTGTRVSRAGLRRLERLAHLRDLRLPATVGDKALEAVRRALPNCSVELQGAKP
jgi:Leucine Rich repeat